jgi:hypothetical protein
MASVEMVEPLATLNAFVYGHEARPMKARDRLCLHEGNPSSRLSPRTSTPMSKPSDRQVCRRQAFGSAPSPGAFREHRITCSTSSTHRSYPTASAHLRLSARQLLVCPNSQGLRGSSSPPATPARWADCPVPEQRPLCSLLTSENTPRALRRCQAGKGLPIIATVRSPPPQSSPFPKFAGAPAAGRLRRRPQRYDTVTRGGLQNLVALAASPASLPNLTSS